jgi:signal transduction histidine kinase
LIKLKRTVSLLITILIFITLIAGGIAFAILFQTSVKQQKEQLAQTARSQARLIESMAMAELSHDEFCADTLRKSTINQIVAAHRQFKGFGQSGEFAIAERVGGKMVFIMKHRLSSLEQHDAIAFNSTHAEPMRRALNGLSGVMTGLDYRGKEVLAAYEPVALLDLGIVAKIDLKEIKEPFIRAGLISGACAVLLIILGSSLFMLITNPLIRRTALNEKRFRDLFEEIPVSILECDFSRVKEYLDTLRIEGETDFDEYLDEHAEVIEKSRNLVIVTDVNQHSLDLFSKHTKDELIGDLNKPFSLADNKSLKKHIIAILNKESLIEEELEILSPDGSKIFLSERWSVPPTDKNTYSKVLISLLDITKRKQAEKELSISEVRFRELFDNMSSGVAIYEAVEDGKDFVFRDFNKGAERIEGIKKHSLIGKKVSEMFPGAGELGIIDIFYRVWKTGDPLNQPISLYSDGVIQSWRENFVYKLPSGEVVAVYNDVTKSKIAEQAREFLNLELGVKNKELEQIVYVTSHDLRSPLVNIQGFSKELQISIDSLKELFSGVDVSVSEKMKVNLILEDDIPMALEYIVTSIKKMDSLLSGLLRLSRFGRVSLMVENLDINRIISDIVTFNEYSLKKTDTRIEVSDLPNCLGDATQINQVFSNLIDNAIKYLDPNRAGIIKITGETLEDLCVYSLEDNGMGIQEEHLTQIFDLFHRLNPESSSGEGLGLTIVRRILDRHNGKITVESNPGAGTIFTVSLPKSVQQTSGKT